MRIAMLATPATELPGMSGQSTSPEVINLLEEPNFCFLIIRSCSS